jgi:hypothetical protein
MALFIAADEPLAIIPWSESECAFHVQALLDGEQSVRRHFTKPNVYYLGAHTGCGCGFAYGQMELKDEDDEAEDVASRKSVAALQEYVRQAVQRLGSVELFSSWQGEWDQDSKTRMEISPEWFGGDEFVLPEKALFRVRASQPGTP